MPGGSCSDDGRPIPIECKTSRQAIYRRGEIFHPVVSQRLVWPTLAFEQSEHTQHFAALVLAIGPSHL